MVNWAEWAQEKLPLISICSAPCLQLQHPAEHFPVYNVPGVSALSALYLALACQDRDVGWSTNSGQSRSRRYSWPWEKTCSGKYRPTLSIVYPCNLLIVIANVGLIGTCLLLNSKGNLPSDGIKYHLGMNTR